VYECRNGGRFGHRGAARARTANVQTGRTS
jgi:hypothetical protein